MQDNSSKIISLMRQLVAYDFWSMRHFAEYDIWLKKIVMYDIRSKLSSHRFSTKRRTPVESKYYLQVRKNINIVKISLNTPLF